MIRLWLVAALALPWAASAWADEWGEVAVVSATLGVQDNRLCLGEGSRGAIGCPTYAPFVSSTSGGLGIGTNTPVRGLDVVGGLRIYGTTTAAYMEVIQRTTNRLGLLMQAGGYAMDFHTNTGTVNFANGTGIGTGVFGYEFVPSTTLHVSGTLRIGNAGESCDANRAGAIRYAGSQFQVCYGSGGWSNLADTSSTVATADRITSGTAAVIANGNSNSISITEAGVTTGYYYNGIWVAGGVSTTGPISATNGYYSGRIGIGAINPSYSIHIASGDIRVERTASKIGFYSVGNPRAAISSNMNNDLVFEYNASVEGMRLTGGKLGIATIAPSATLHVIGNALTTSWTGINFSSTNVTATAPLEVSGTVSATNFVGNGSGLTNISASAVSIALNDLTDAATAATNVFLGHEGGSYGNNDTENTATGINSLDYLNNSTGIGNSAFGFSALTSNQSGDNNSAFGRYALSDTGTGIDNTAMGAYALQNNTTGSQNTAIGRTAMHSQENSAGQTAVGYDAMRYISGTSADVALYNTALGFRALRGSTTPDNNTGDQNTAIGYSALINNSTGRSNNAMGTNSLYENTTGSNNAAMGYSALRWNTTGQNNTALGHGTLFYQQNSVAQTAIGYLAMYYISGTTADPATANTAVGNLALLGSVTTTDNTGDQNTALGYSALVSNTSGSYNTAIGTQSLYNTTTGSQNTALGRNAGYGLVTGSSNILIGYGADTPANNTSNFLNIGSAISGTYTTGGVINFLAGIKSAGVVTATYFEGDGSRLTNVTAASADRITSGTAAVIANGGSGYVSLTSGASTWGYLGVSQSYLTAVNFGANVGIGTTTPSKTLTVNGDAAVSGTMQIAGTGSESCTMGTLGTMRLNPNTRKIEVCRQ